MSGEEQLHKIFFVLDHKSEIFWATQFLFLTAFLWGTYLASDWWDNLQISSFFVQVAKNWSLAKFFHWVSLEVKNFFRDQVLYELTRAFLWYSSLTKIGLNCYIITQVCIILMFKITRQITTCHLIKRADGYFREFWTITVSLIKVDIFDLTSYKITSASKNSSNHSWKSIMTYKGMSLCIAKTRGFQGNILITGLNSRTSASNSCYLESLLPIMHH